MPLEDNDQKPGLFERAVFLLLLVLILVAPLVITSAVEIDTAKWFVLQVGGTGLLAAWFALRTLHGRPLIQWDAISVCAVLFLGTQVISLAVATNIWTGIEVISRQIGLLAVFLLVTNATRNASDRDRVLWTIALLGAAISLYGIAQHWGYDFFPWETHKEVPVERGVSFFGHATFAGSALVILIPVTVGLALTRTGRPGRIAAGLITLTMLYHLSFSGARVATVGLFVSALVVITVFVARSTINKGEAAHARPASRGLLSALISVVVVIALGSVLLVRAWDVKDSDLFAIRQASLAQRFFAWETASRMFVSNPALGVGVGNFAVVSPQYWNTVESTRYARHDRRPFNVHNEYLEVAVEQGLPGIATLLGLIAFGLTGSYGIATRARDPRERTLGVAYFAAMVATSIDMTVTYTLQVPGSALLVWVLLGVIAHTARSAATGDR